MAPPDGGPAAPPPTDPRRPSPEPDSDAPLADTLRSFPAGDDATVVVGGPGLGGGEAELSVGVDPAGDEHQTFLKFTVTGTGPVTGASLLLTVADPSADGGTLHHLDNDAWDEASIDGTTFPADAGDAIAGASSGDLAGRTLIELDVSSVVTGDGVYTFVLRGGATGLARYHATEAGPGTAPELAVTSASPGPSADWYVSPDGPGDGDGRSWATAWPDLDRIEWGAIDPGHVIALDGGGPGQVRIYAEPLRVGASGTEADPITIRLGTEGQAVLDGGGDLLPGCSNTEDTSFRASAHSRGVNTLNHDWIVFDGTKRAGIVIRDFQTGMRIDRGSVGITVRGLEITNNGFQQAMGDSNYPGWQGWGPNGPGVNLGGSRITFDGVDIHDNGQDAIQSLYTNATYPENNLGDVVITNSWLHNTRALTEVLGNGVPAPDEKALPFNFCSHTDALQIYGGNQVSGIEITDSVLGPGMVQNIMIGTSTSLGVTDVVLRDVLLLSATHNGIIQKDNGPFVDDDWTLDRVTAYCPHTIQCLRLAAGQNHEVIDSIVVGRGPSDETNINWVEEPGPATGGNCRWHTRGHDTKIAGAEVDPGLTGASPSVADYFDPGGDYAPTNPDCAGSRLTSIAAIRWPAPDRPLGG